MTESGGGGVSVPPGRGSNDDAQRPDVPLDRPDGPVLKRGVSAAAPALMDDEPQNAAGPLERADIDAVRVGVAYRQGAVMRHMMVEEGSTAVGEALFASVFETQELDSIKPLEAFFAHRALSHDAAAASLLGQVSVLDDVTKFNYDFALKGVSPWLFYASTFHGSGSGDSMAVDGQEGSFTAGGSADRVDGGTEPGVSLRRVIVEGITRKLLRTDAVFRGMPVKFMGEKDLPTLAMECPRFVSPEASLSAVGLEAVINPGGDYAIEALRYQVMFALFAHRVMEKQDGHRRVYFLASVAALLAHKAGHSADIPPACVSRHVPSLAPEFANIAQSADEARRFLDARLSLLLPDKSSVSCLIERRGASVNMANLVQEDFITADLIAFAQRAGLYEEYEPLFKALHHYRRLQFIRNFHFNIGERGRGKGERVSLMGVFRRQLAAVERKQTGASAVRPVGHLPGAADDSAAVSVPVAAVKRGASMPKVLSLGCGDAFLEKLLANISDHVVGVDKDHNSTGVREEEFSNGGHTTLYRVGVGKRNLDDPKDSMSLRREIINYCGGGADVVVLADVLHETDDPVNYLIDVARRVVEPGGYLYVTDPIHSELVDGQTSVTLHPYDSTRHSGSMLSIERCYRLLVYLEAKGFRVVSVGVVPGAYAGYSDAFWRLSLVIKKPERGDPRPFEIKGEEGGPDEPVLRSNEDLFNVFPLLLIANEDRAKLTANLGASDLLRNKGISRGRVREFVIMRLLEEPRPLADLMKDMRAEPYPIESLEELFRSVKRDDRELRERNRKAAEVIVLARLLKETLNINVPLSTVPGWEQYIP